MHCSNCNKTIPDGSTHCPYCYSAQSGESAYEPTDDVLKEKYGKPFIGIPTIVTIVILYAIIMTLTFKGEDTVRDAGFKGMNDLFGYILALLPAVNVLFFFPRVNKFSELLPIDAVHIGTYFIGLLAAIGGAFLPPPCFGFVLSTAAVLISLFTLVKLQTISRIVGLNIMPGIIFSAVVMTIATIAAMATDGIAWMLVLFIVIMLVHVFIMASIRVLWQKSALYVEQQSSVDEDSKKNDIPNISDNSNSINKCDLPPKAENAAAEIVCENCGKTIPADSDFCLKCGARVVKQDEPKTIICKECGKEIPSDSDFCLKCGTRIKDSDEPKSKNCKSCGTEIHSDNGSFPRFCPKCGVQIITLEKSQ